MKLPSDIFIAGLAPGKVYYFESEQLSTNIPHYFICLTINADELVILACCTSQFEKRKRFIESRNLPHSTLVWISPNDENGFSRDTFVDCNSYFDYSKEELKRLYESDILSFTGEVSEDVLVQIYIGMKDSPLIEEAIKDRLPEIG
ncbi:MAG: hypothetical protein AAF798_13775 [Bacteroidota bacterium]